MNKGKNSTYLVALGGMLAALSVALMFFSALIPVGRMIFPAAAGILLVCAVYELGEGFAFLIFAVVGLLSLLLPDKAEAVYYILFLGHYPIVKSFLERVQNRLLNWILKLAVFNLCAVAALAVIIYLLGLTPALLRFGIPLVWLALNVAFVVYDIAISGVAKVYVTRIGKILNRK